MAGIFKSVGGVFNTLLGGGTPPKPKPPLPMPDLNDPQLQAEKQRAAQDAAARSGRASTILSSDYSGTLLGG